MRLRRPYGEFFRESRVRCRACLDPGAEGWYSPLVVADGGEVWGHSSAPADLLAAWEALPENVRLPRSRAPKRRPRRLSVDALVREYAEAGVPVEGEGPNFVSVSGCMPAKTCLLNVRYRVAVRRHPEPITRVLRFKDRFEAYDIWGC